MADNDTVNILGHTFHKMDAFDYEGFAGADDGSYMCEPDTEEGLLLIYSPSTGHVTAITEDGAEVVWGIVRQ